MQKEEEINRVSLATLNDGAAVEAFDEELKKVCADIADFDKKPDGMREINLKVKIKPNHAREKSEVQIECSSKLGARNPQSTTIWLGKVDGEYVATEENIRQGKLAFKEQEEEVNG